MPKHNDILKKSFFTWREKKVETLNNYSDPQVEGNKDDGKGILEEGGAGLAVLRDKPYNELGKRGVGFGTPMRTSSDRELRTTNAKG